MESAAARGGDGLSGVRQTTEAQQQVAIGGDGCLKDKNMSYCEEDNKI